MQFCSLTLGCKVNQYETQAVEGILKSRGHTQTKPGAGCDVCIINTCAVTAESVRKSRQAVRRLKKMEPRALIAVCGCLSQLDPQMAVALGADLVGGSGDRYGFALEIERMTWTEDGKTEDGRTEDGKTEDGRTDPYFSVKLSDCFEELAPGVGASRTRALLKIQDGCDNFCAYCVIPYARGRARSLPLERVADHAGRLEGQGYREIVVTGIEISSYGKDLSGNPTLNDAIKVISRAAPHARLRLGSIDPFVVTEGFCCDLSSIPHFCNHFHLSLQSGCDETLRRMGRKYDTDTVREAILTLRRRFPDCGITADLIVGFPGETDAEFEQTLKFIKTAAFSGMHIFPFSPRPGTRAADMPDQVIKGVRRERARIAAAAAREMALSFRFGLIGKTVEVLLERKRGVFWTGHSGNYIEITVKGAGEKNSVQDVQITSVEYNLTTLGIMRYNMPSIARRMDMFTERIYNFSPGPSMLPLPVLEQAAAEMTNHRGSGMSVMEMSHRSKVYLDIFDETKADLKRHLKIPDTHEVIFIQGGATLQFSAVPMNLIGKTGIADYAVTGNFSKLAMKEAQRYGEIRIACSSEDKNHTYIPLQGDIKVSTDASYFHYCVNNTIYGTEWKYIPETGGVPLVCDMSSNIMSVPVDISKYGLIYAGVQKNMAPAGVAVVIIDKSLVGNEHPLTPKLMNYKLMIDSDSMINTPPCYTIYVLGLVLKWLDAQGGIEGMARIKAEKAKVLYDVLDDSKLFIGCTEKAARSDMNVTFRTSSAEIDDLFVKEAKKAGFENLKGHRSVGGMRASIYNAMPFEGVQGLAAFMQDFETINS